MKSNVIGKLKEVGESETAGAVPVPDKLAVWGLPDALSLTETVALRAPLAVGLKVTLIVQLRLTPNVDGESGQLLVWAKSPAFVPVIAIELIVKAAVPLLVSVIVCAVLVVFIGWLPNDSEVGERDAPAPAAVPYAA